MGFYDKRMKEKIGVGERGRADSCCTMSMYSLAAKKGRTGYSIYASAFISLRCWISRLYIYRLCAFLRVGNHYTYSSDPCAVLARKNGLYERCLLNFSIDFDSILLRHRSACIYVLLFFMMAWPGEGVRAEDRFLVGFFAVADLVVKCNRIGP